MSCLNHLFASLQVEDAKAQGEAREVVAAGTIAELEAALVEEKAQGQARSSYHCL